jgi:sensor histidine kinase YesM
MWFKMNVKKKYKIPSGKKLIVLSALAVTLVFALPRIAVLFRTGQPEFSPDRPMTDFLLRTIYHFCVAVIFFAVNLESRKIRIGPVAIHFANLYHRIAVTTILFLVLFVALFRFHQLWVEPVLPERVFRFLFNLNLTFEVLLVVLISQIYRQLFRNYQIRMDNETLLKTNAEARYEVLKNQINPHFLFNSFNTLNSLIVNDQDKAVNYVNNMSDVFRYVLESSRKDRVTVDEEMVFMKAYIQMLKGRFGEKLQFKIEIEPGVQAFLLPPMALQILVENAVKHNVISHKQPLEIHIFSRGPQLTVFNHLQERKIKEPSTGLGLFNLNQRCIYLLGKELIVKRTAQDFLVTIPLMSYEDTDN